MVHIPISSHMLGLAPCSFFRCSGASWPDLQAEPEMEVVQFPEGKSCPLPRRGVLPSFQRSKTLKQDIDWFLFGGHDCFYIFVLATSTGVFIFKRKLALKWRLTTQKTELKDGIKRKKHRMLQGPMIFVAPQAYYDDIQLDDSVFGHATEIYVFFLRFFLRFFSIQLMSHWWFGARWFGFVGSPERDCYLGVHLESQTTGPQATNEPLADQQVKNHSMRPVNPNMPRLTSWLGKNLASSSCREKQPFCNILPYPYHPCMVYLPTFTIKFSQM